MDSHSTPDAAPQPAFGMPAKRVYPIAVAALIIGLATGYFWLGGRNQTSAGLSRGAAPAASRGIMPAGHPVPTMEQMKAMADVKAAPLLEALKKKPKDAKLLAQVAALYAGTHQFSTAATYYKKTLEIDPKNATARTELASSLYYSGDVDGALSQLEQALKYQPTDVNALFNLGMIRYKGKDDAPGAIAAWQQLLKAHPDLDRKPIVERLIAEAKQNPAAKK